MNLCHSVQLQMFLCIKVPLLTVRHTYTKKKPTTQYAIHILIVEELYKTFQVENHFKWNIWPQCDRKSKNRLQQMSHSLWLYEQR